MGFYLRKSISLGPVRLNLSRSGLGTSVGVKGFRIGVGPKGKYVHAGRGGLYYRKSLNGPKQTPSQFPPVQQGRETVLQEIESGDVKQMIDGDSPELLKELNRVQKRIQLFPILLVIALLFLPGTASNGPWALLLYVIIAGAMLLYARNLDVTKGTVILNYELEPAAEKTFARLRETFQDITKCERVWNIKAFGQNHDLKRQAGATKILQRTKIQPSFSKPRRVVCNIDVPCLPAGKETLYFFPDRILVYAKKSVGAVPYAELGAKGGQTRFIEEESVPKDSQIVGQTWKYVNKSGGPDRRFRDNRELPVMLYGEVTLNSESGLNELFECSAPDKASPFAEAMTAIAKTI